MTLLNQIKSANWQISLTGFGNIVEGNEDINQSIGIILMGVKGSDPFRPLFGSELWDYIDTPLTTAVPNIKRAIFEAVDVWEKRVRVIKIDHEFIKQDVEPVGMKSGIHFKIFWESLLGTGNDELSLYFDPTSSDIPFSLTALFTEDGEAVTTESSEIISV